ncbi:MAG: cobalamin B12-binding domain-containing protein [Candidatus Dormibacteraeota bacterium]|nr:cobalamin B12-binding domain-containing protein [Candidatus Dormibacteraeota bacterium]
MSEPQPLRIVLAKVGLDGHDRGIKVVARALRDAGFEVIYVGLRQTPQMLVEAAVQEDARLIGVSLHSGAHMTLLPAVMEELRRRNADDIVVFGGGIIPAEDIRELKGLGVAELFTPGTPLKEIVAWVRSNVAAAPV